MKATPELIIGIIIVLGLFVAGELYYSSYRSDLDTAPIVINHDTGSITHTINASMFSYLKHIPSNIKGITTANITIDAENVACSQVTLNESGKMINYAKCQADVIYRIGRYENNTFEPLNITYDVVFSHKHLSEAVVENSDVKIIRTVNDAPAENIFVFANGTYTVRNTAYFNQSGNYKWSDRIGATVLDPLFAVN